MSDKATRKFILTEAAAMVPLVRRILADVRECRCQIHALRRQLKKVEGTPAAGLITDELSAVEDRLRDALGEAESLGIVITDGIRCEALFPFDHKWVGPAGDNKIRRAYFVYSDAQPGITQWFFDGWPHDRRELWPGWWDIYRPGQVRVTPPAESQSA